MKDHRLILVVILPLSPTRGADVDADPVARGAGPVNLTATDRGVAAIYLRYRLYTHQPDEMITLRALATMEPEARRFDPKLYQYGGLFIYPVGVLLRLCGAAGFIDVRSDIVYYLDHPEEFAKFYIVARAYAAAWGAIGLLVVYAIANRLCNAWAGVLAAVLFAVMPVVVCMGHEGKPHLPGAVLMLLAVLLTMRYVDSNRRRDGILLAVTCGAALGMVLSSLPILILVPLAEVLGLQRVMFSVRLGLVSLRASLRQALVRTLQGAAISAGVYLITNPYIVINVFANREVLASNFGNSLAMYDVTRISEGLLRVLELTVEGASPAILVGGLIMFVAVPRRKRWILPPLTVPAVLVFLQFVLLGAGKPAEFGRFGVFPGAALAIGTACCLAGAWRVGSSFVKPVVGVLVFGSTAFAGWGYLWNFYCDARGTDPNTRIATGRWLARQLADASDREICVLAEPAPYCCPPVNFASTKVWRQDADRGVAADEHAPLVVAHDGRTLFGPRPPPPGRRRTVDIAGRFRSPISWANKPFRIYLPGAGD